MAYFVAFLFSFRKQEYPKDFYFSRVYVRITCQVISPSLSLQEIKLVPHSHSLAVHKVKGSHQRAQNATIFVKVFRRQALHISILLGNILPQATGNSKSNRRFLSLARRLEQFALEKSGASNLVLVYTRINRPDVQCPVDHGTRKSEKCLAT
jgi:hypothetical protein